jgi:hypothetical protein
LEEIIVVIVLFIDECFVDFKMLLVGFHLKCYGDGLEAPSGFLYNIVHPSISAFWPGKT